MGKIPTVIGAVVSQEVGGSQLLVGSLIQGDWQCLPRFCEDLRDFHDSSFLAFITGEHKGQIGDYIIIFLKLLGKDVTNSAFPHSL